MTAPPRLLFRENQRMRDPWRWIFLLGGSALVAGTALWMISRQLRHGDVFSERYLPFGLLLLVAVLTVVINAAILIYFLLMKLETEVTTEGVFLRFRPRQRKLRRVDLNGVCDIAVVSYRPYMDYGGRGLRRTRRATVYSITGNEGIRIDYDNGCHILIGSQDPAGLERAIRQALPDRS